MKAVLALLTIVVVGSFVVSAQTNSLQLRSGSKSVILAAPGTAGAGTYTLTFPDGNGSLGEVLTTNGSGTLSWGGSLTLLSGTSGLYSDVVDESNRTNTYITLGPAGSNTDWAYLRQIGGDNTFHLALDFHDDGNDARFSIRSFNSTLSPDPSPVTRLALDANGRFMVGAASSQVPFFFQASGDLVGGENPSSTDAAALMVSNSNASSSDADALVLIQTAANTGGNPYLSFDIISDAGFTIGLDNGDNNLKVKSSWDFNSGTIMTFERSTGYVGIGEENPDIWLHVKGGSGYLMDLEETGTDANGSLHIHVPNADHSVSQQFVVFTTQGQTRGEIAYSGGTLTYGTASDYRLKDDLRDFQGLTLIEKIPVYDFAWKEDGRRMYGFMAHELQAFVPSSVTGSKDAVDERGNPQYQMVDYSMLTPVLTKAVQELHAVVEKQQREIDELKKLVREMSERK